MNIIGWVILFLLAALIFDILMHPDEDKEEFYSSRYFGLFPYYYPPYYGPYLYSGCVENTFGNVDCYSPPYLY